MNIFRVGLTVLARFFIALAFLAGAVNKILHWQETEKALMNVFCDWQAYVVGYSDVLEDMLSESVPMTPLILLIATFCELIGALSVLLGVKEKLGATLLLLFLIPATIFMHQFWFVEGPLREIQLAHFLKNVAIMGGLLMIILRESEKSDNVQRYMSR